MTSSTESSPLGSGRNILICRRTVQSFVAPTLVGPNGRAIFTGEARSRVGTKALAGDTNAPTGQAHACPAVSYARTSLYILTIYFGYKRARDILYEHIVNQLAAPISPSAVYPDGLINSR
jgi:hypothetical protein